MRTREQTVVHFAGGGGSCTGIEEALGFSPDHAINHDAAALVRKNCPEMAIRTASRWQQPQAERRAA